MRFKENSRLNFLIVACVAVGVIDIIEESHAVHFLALVEMTQESMGDSSAAEGICIGLPAVDGFIEPFQRSFSVIELDVHSSNLHTHMVAVFLV